MKRKTQRVLPAGLDAARRGFEQWRATREGPSRIPERLWTVAMRAARRFGVHRTSRALRLDYAVLKRRATADAAVSLSQDIAHPSFVELVPAGGSRAEYVVELEDPSGARMRLEVKGIPAPDLVALTRSLRLGGA